MDRNFTFTVNGQLHQIETKAETPLIYVLRNNMGLTGVRYGCGLEQCGSCMVLIDGEPAYACSRGVDSVNGREVLTVEGLHNHGHPLFEAFLAEQAGQCGYCLSGILINAKALLDRNSSPSREDIKAALDKNLCRCGAHVRIINAVERAAATLRGISRA